MVVAMLECGPVSVSLRNLCRGVCACCMLEFRHVIRHGDCSYARVLSCMPISALTSAYCLRVCRHHLNGFLFLCSGFAFIPMSIDSLLMVGLLVGLCGACAVGLQILKLYASFLVLHIIATVLSSLDG